MDDGQDLPRLRRQVCHWPENRPTATKAQRTAAGAQLRTLALPLRALGPRDIASTAREFLLAGYTVQDLLHAIDHTPEGPRRMLSLDRADGSARVRGWLRWRLGDWRDDAGQPVPSPSQRAGAEAERIRTHAAAGRARILAERTARAEAARRGPSPAKLAALAQIKADRATRADLAP